MAVRSAFAALCIAVAVAALLSAPTHAAVTINWVVLSSAVEGTGLPINACTEPGSIAGGLTGSSPISTAPNGDLLWANATFRPSRASVEEAARVLDASVARCIANATGNAQLLYNCLYLALRSGVAGMTAMDAHGVVLPIVAGDYSTPDAIGRTFLNALVFGDGCYPERLFNTFASRAFAKINDGTCATQSDRLACSLGYTTTAAPPPPIPADYGGSELLVPIEFGPLPPFPIFTNPIDTLYPFYTQCVANLLTCSDAFYAGDPRAVFEAIYPCVPIFNRRTALFASEGTVVPAVRPIENPFAPLPPSQPSGSDLCAAPTAARPNVTLCVWPPNDKIVAVHNLRPFVAAYYNSCGLVEFVSSACAIVPADRATWDPADAQVAPGEQCAVVNDTLFVVAKKGDRGRARWYQIRLSITAATLPSSTQSACGPITSRNITLYVVIPKNQANPELCTLPLINATTASATVQFDMGQYVGDAFVDVSTNTTRAQRWAHLAARRSGAAAAPASSASRYQLLKTMQPQTASDVTLPPGIFALYIIIAVAGGALLVALLMCACDCVKQSSMRRWVPLYDM